MRLSATEKIEIIRLVTASDLGVNRTLRELGINKCREKLTGKFPVVLVVRINSNPYRYPTIYDLTEEDFAKLSATRVKSRLHPIKEDLAVLQQSAEDYVRNSRPFQLESFEYAIVLNNPSLKQRKRKIELLRTSNKFDFSPYLKKFTILKENHHEHDRISFVYAEYIKRLIQEERVATAINYYESFQTLNKFRDNVYYSDITVSYLFQLEKWMKSLGRSPNTIGMRIRALRAIFNEAIEMKIIKLENCYPFWKKKIPNSGQQKLEKSLVKRRYCQNLLL